MPNDTDVSSAPPRRRRRLRYVALIVLIVLSSPFAAWFAWSRVEAARLDRALDALEARHEPLDAADFDVKPATAEQRDASHLYAQALKLVQEGTRNRAASLRPTIETLCGLTPSSTARAGDIAALQAFEDSHKPELDMLDRASRLDAAGWEDQDRPRRNSLEETGAANLGVVNAVRIARLGCTGSVEPAAAALYSTLRLRRMLPASFYNYDPLPTAHGLHALLTSTSSTVPLLREIQGEYERAADEHAVERRMLYWRADSLTWQLPGVFSDAPPGMMNRPMTPVEAIGLRLTRPLRDHAIVSELRVFDEILEAAKQPWPAKIEAAAVLAKKYPREPSTPGRSIVVATLARAFASAGGRTVFFAAAVVNAAESLARARASAAAVAVTRYRLAHSGALPNSLADLVPEFLAVPLMDPFSGREMLYRRDDAGFKVYSVGHNGRDDGSQWEQSSDLQQSRRGEPLDIGISVGAPAVTRQ